MPSFVKKILFTTDLSKNSIFACRYALRLADALDAKITVLYVLPAPDTAVQIPTIVQMGEEAYQKLQEERFSEIAEGIKRRVHDLVQREFKELPGEEERVASVLIHQGHVVDEILKTAMDSRCDLILMGSHGKGILAHTFLGSVPDKVLRRSHIPVLVVPMPEGIKESDL